MKKRLPSPRSHQDTRDRFMKLALALAARGLGSTSPNPVVGALVVRHGRILGRGYHRLAGEPHAEVNALEDCQARGHDPRGADLFVTLEPCCHFGRTPPCVDRIVKTGLARVFAAIEDPNPLVGGKGLTKLRAAGVGVEVGTCADEARELNAAFFKHLSRGLPYFILKAGCSLDGKIAPADGNSRWITADAARKEGQKIRAIVDAVLVGANTIRNDNPALTLRIPSRRARPLIRLVLAGRLDLDPGLAIFQNLANAPTWILTTPTQLDLAREKKNPLLSLPGLRLLACPADAGGRPDALEAALLLHRENLHRVLIEGGGEINAAFLNARLVDRLEFFFAPLLIGGGRGANSIGLYGGPGASDLNSALRLRWRRVRRLGSDLRVSADLEPVGV